MPENKVRYWIAGVSATVAVVACAILYSLPDQPPTVEGWSHATQIIANDMMDPIALYEDHNTCRTVFTGFYDSVVCAHDLFYRNPAHSGKLSNGHGDVYEDAPVGTRWELTRKRLNRDCVYELGDGVTPQNAWFVDATTVAMIAQREGATKGDVVLRILDVCSGLIQTIDLSATIGLLDCNVLYISPWNGLIAVANNYDKTVYLLDVRLYVDVRLHVSQWRASVTNFIDATRYKITTVAISPDGKTAYCLDSAYERMILKWRIGKSKVWERVGKNDNSIDGAYMGTIAIDQTGNIACVRVIHESRNDDEVYLDRFNPRGERKTTQLTSKTEVWGATVAFNRKGDSAYLLLGGRNSDDNDTIYRVNFIGSMSTQSVPRHSTLIPGKSAYLLCRYGKFGKSRPKRDDVLYEID